MKRNGSRYTRVRTLEGGSADLQLRLIRAAVRLLGRLVRVRLLGILMRMLDLIFRQKSFHTVVSISPDTAFAFPSTDPYWAFFVHGRRIYEGSVEAFLSRISEHDFCFIDCGANYGYWSALASSAEFGGHTSLAIEASSETFSVLRMTARLNGDRFDCLQRAVSSSSDEVVRFAEGGRPAGRHIIDGEIEKMVHNRRRILTPREQVGEVVTITLDDVVQRFLSLERQFVVKLDVEGAELHALRGARELARMGAVFIYEDHGADLSSAVTRHVLADGFDVWIPSQEGTLNRITSLSDLSDLKVDRRAGYDLVAAKGMSQVATAVRQLEG